MSHDHESAPSAAAAAHAEGAPAEGGAAQVQQAYGRLRTAWREQGGLDYKTRMKLLDDVMKWVRKNRQELITALNSDYGHRSPHETLMAEVFTVVDDIKHIRAHLAEWMAEQPRPVAATFKPGTARVIWQPIGVVGVIAPWNYPFQLGILPVVAAISAGCRVMIKPSEFSPATGGIFRRIATEVLPPDVFAVVEGGVDVSAEFSRQPFDHLFFTGSTSVGRHVMRAASEHLTPVTLELGGKSPAIVHKDHSLAQACARIVAGKGFNAGQTCIAPDYVLVHEDKRDALVAELQKQFAAQYPTVAANPDYTAVINQRHYDRLQAWLQDARDRGAKVVQCNPAGETLDPAVRKLPLTLVLDCPDDATVLQDEIFGPVLPIVTYRELDGAIAYVNERPRPLALYYFDWNKKRQEQVLQNTWSGGVTLNDTILHFSQLELPFGGVGPSGMGAYHGWYGFRTFSHEKGIFSQSRVNGGKLITAPYGKVTDTLLKVMIG
ncbi:MAG: coniferyl aldehyde dehydrogenase [Alphaproteobacteria bacterium]|nr:coniferyl aldehyde dehydrogenase [Alphaproteobacteria bacterium]